jgi:anti-sigma factor RsiW
MSGQILRFDDSPHRETDALLPWYVNGTLEGDELTRTEQHLRECARCRREVELLRQVQLACKIAAPARDATASLQRLRRRIDGGWWHGPLGTHLRQFLAPWRRAPGWARWAIVAEFAGMLTLAMVLAVSGGESQELYRTLGSPGAPTAGVGSIAIVFTPEVQESELRRIVRAAGARVVDGPTASNAYVLEVPTGHRDAAVARLRAEPAVVLAQPLTSAPDR